MVTLERPVFQFPDQFKKIIQSYSNVTFIEWTWDILCDSYKPTDGLKLCFPL